MKISATIKQIHETEVVTEKFSKRLLILETGDQYPKDVAIEFINDHTSKLDDLAEGEFVHVEVNPESREHNGRWYTSLKGWKITK